MRINKYLAEKGIATRRGADELIEKGLVLVNGEKAVLGQDVSEDDQVEIKSKKKAKKYVYLAYNKPKGVITHSPQGNEKSIAEMVNMPGVFPVGRLDKDSHGLIILTNDGRITDRLLSPKHYHEKEYVVRVKKALRPSFKEHMEKGVVIEDEKTKPAKVKILSEKTFSIVLTEGKKHQIRRMCSAMHQEVEDLMRVRIMNVRLSKMQNGKFREIKGEELEVFLKSLGL